MKDFKPIKYQPGIFDTYKAKDDLYYWDGFPELMWGLGFEMDCGESFREYRDNSTLALKEAHNEREEKRNVLFLLEHADLQLVGNYLFSEWRYYSHWALRYDEYDVDFLRRIIAILETKYSKVNTTE